MISLALHYALAASSLLQENPTIDEVVHLPAGITYWQKRTFRLYHHNPPLVKLIAAIPVVLANPNTHELYQRTSWLSDPPDQSSFAHAFAFYNIDRYFELFTQARLVMPLFAVLGGLIIFVWSRSLYGTGGGILSLALWALCPNILAHGRLVTTDVGATVIGFAATYAFWRYLGKPTWKTAAVAGIALGLAQLSKFSMLLLYGIWPLLWLVREAIVETHARRIARGLRAAIHGVMIVIISIFIIDLGYGFEKVGIPLGKFEFACKSLTKPVEPGVPRPRSKNPLLDGAWKYRINRFRVGAFANLPVPLPEHFVLGLDEQKLEAEGIPVAFHPGSTTRLTTAEAEKNIVSYPVYLDGVNRRSSWSYYYLFTLFYKVPEGTWLLGLASLVVLGFSARRFSRERWSDEISVLIFPLIAFLVMSLATNINIGLRYVLPIFPYVFVVIGRLAPWSVGFSGVKAIAARVLIGVGVSLTVAATLAIHPHYLAYFNWMSGGPSRGSEHLIDSNLDWGQDLVGLARWARKNAPGERIGLAYFGQISPNILKPRGEGFDWFVPPALPGKIAPSSSNSPRLPPARALKPGLYAVSASILQGLPWNLYDPLPTSIYPAWRCDSGAFAYFHELEPVDQIGYSILLFRVTQADADRLAHHWNPTPDRGRSRK